MDKKNKISQIAWMNALAITLVVIGHADVTPTYDQLWIKRWIYSFHMALFIFISGFLFCYTTAKVKEISIGHFWARKAQRLLLPFIVVNTIIFLIKSSFFASDNYVQNPVTLTWASYLNSTLFYPIGFMWFLPALFMIFVLFALIAKKVGFTNKYTKWWLEIGIVLWGTSLCIPPVRFLQISNAISYSVYFAMGIVYALRKDIIDSWLTQYRWIVLVILGICSFSLMLPPLVAELVGILFILSLSLQVGEGIRNKCMVLSDYSFTIYLLSYFPQMLVRGPIYNHFEGVNEYVFSVLSILLGLFVPIGVGVIYSQIKNTNKLTKFLGNTIGL